MKPVNPFSPKAFFKQAWSGKSVFLLSRRYCSPHIITLISFDFCLPNHVPLQKIGSIDLQCLLTRTTVVIINPVTIKNYKGCNKNLFSAFYNVKLNLTVRCKSVNLCTEKLF